MHLLYIYIYTSYTCIQYIHTTHTYTHSYIYITNILYYTTYIYYIGEGALKVRDNPRALGTDKEHMLLTAEDIWYVI